MKKEKIHLEYLLNATSKNMALVNDGERHIQLLREGAGARDAAHVRRDDHEVLVAAAELLKIVVAEDGRSEEVIDRDIKEAPGAGRRGGPW